MKIKLVISVLILLALLSCGSTDQGKLCADKFFSFVINEKYDSALNLMENMPLKDTANIIGMKNFGNNNELGKLLSAEKSFGFNTNISNGITTVVLPYNLKYENAEISRQVTIIDRGNGYKVVVIE